MKLRWIWDVSFLQIKVIGDVEGFVKSITEGIKDLVLPLVKEGKVHEFETVVRMVTDSLSSVNTKYKLNKILPKKN